MWDTYTSCGVRPRTPEPLVLAPHPAHCERRSTRRPLAPTTVRSVGSAPMGTNQRRQIAMTDDEVAAFIERSRTATMATVGPTGHPHLVAMWYAVVDGADLVRDQGQVAEGRRTSGATTASPCMVEDGLHLRHAARRRRSRARAVIIDDPDAAVGGRRQRVGALQRALHRGGEAARRVHAQQAGRRAGRRRPRSARGTTASSAWTRCPLGGTTAEYLPLSAGRLTGLVTTPCMPVGRAASVPGARADRRRILKCRSRHGRTAGASLSRAALQQAEPADGRRPATVVTGLPLTGDRPENR